MIILNSVQALQDYLGHFKRQRIGFVPTLGALHQGHLSLVDQSKSDSELAICSIYLNPTQFNESKDLEKYPRTLAEDIIKLEERECDILFYPSDEEIYPDGMDYDLHLDLGHVMEPMEGEYRPGHFEGMVQVVHRLLDIVQPDRIYMGQKDYQQYLIVNEMVKQLEWDIEVIASPIIREEDGLAMSSRNQRLDPAIRNRANILYETLLSVRENADKSTDLEYLENWALEQLRIPDFQPEYFRIVNAETLESVKSLNQAASIIACTAVWAGEVRLIDNLFIKKDR